MQFWQLFGAFSLPFFLFQQFYAWLPFSKPPVLPEKPRVVLEKSQPGRDQPGVSVATGYFVGDKIGLPATEQGTGKQTQLEIASAADDTVAVAAAAAVAVAVVAGKDVLLEFQPLYT